MSFVTTQPEELSATAATLLGLGEAMVAHNGAAAAATTGLAPAASDIVSAMTAAQFEQHGVAYQQIAAQAAEVHEQLVAALRPGAGAYGAGRGGRGGGLIGFRGDEPFTDFARDHFRADVFRGAVGPLLAAASTRAHVMPRSPEGG